MIVLCVCFVMHCCCLVWRGVVWRGDCVVWQGDVALPPWASSAEDFIEKQREALESEYVNALAVQRRLPLWLTPCKTLHSHQPPCTRPLYEL